MRSVLFSSAVAVFGASATADQVSHQPSSSCTTSANLVERAEAVDGEVPPPGYTRVHPIKIGFDATRVLPLTTITEEAEWRTIPIATTTIRGRPGGSDKHFVVVTVTATSSHGIVSTSAPWTTAWANSTATRSTTTSSIAVATEKVKSEKQEKIFQTVIVPSQTQEKEKKGSEDKGYEKTQKDKDTEKDKETEKSIDTGARKDIEKRKAHKLESSDEVLKEATDEIMAIWNWLWG